MGLSTDESTRLRFGLLLVAILAIEAVLSHFLKGLPFVAVAGIQAGIYTTFVTGRTITDVTRDRVTVNHESAG